MRKFVVTGGLIMILAMLAAGQITSGVVKNATVEHTAAASALLVGNLVAPLVQSLADNDVLEAAAIRDLDDLTGQEAFSGRFPHVDIWKSNGLVVYSRSPELMGHVFESPEGLKQALLGSVSAVFTDLSAREHVLRSFEESFLEIYVPIRRVGTQEIIAVAEIHEVTAPLRHRLFHAQVQNWLTVAAATALTMLCLVGVVHRASRTIDRQQMDLRRRIDEIERVSRANRLLRSKVQRAAGRAAELTEINLRRIGADLHDGPAQLIGYTALMLEHVRLAPNEKAREAHLSKLEATLKEALEAIRSVSKGLQSPEIEHLSLGGIIERAVRGHHHRTGSQAKILAGPETGRLSPAMKICVFRFVQEGLNNAFRHASPGEHLVTYAHAAENLTVSVQDKGPKDGAARSMPAPGLGLVGLRERVESLGGTLRLVMLPDGRTVLEMTVTAAEE